MRIYTITINPYSSEVTSATFKDTIEELVNMWYDSVEVVPKTKGEC